MPTALPAIDYTARDFDTIKEVLKTHLQTKFPNTWRDMYESDMGTAWLELVAYSYCFAGNTKVSLVNGEEREIAELVGQGPVVVYAVDESLNVVPVKAVAQMTRKNAQLIEVELDNKEKVRCTPDHLWMLRDGSFREARLLKAGDSLMPLYRKANQWGYELFKSLRTGCWNLTHRRFAEGNKKELVHHQNFNKRDNRPENLTWLLRSEHAAYHKEKARHLVEESRTPKGRKRRSENMKRMRQEVYGDPKRYAAWRQKQRELGPARSRVMKKNIEEGKIQPHGEETIRQASKKHKEWWQSDAGKALKKKLSDMRKGKPLTPKHRQAISRGSKGKPKPPGFGEKIRQAKLGIPRSPGTRAKMRAARLAYWQERKKKEADAAANHKVRAVRPLDHREDAYDLVVLDGPPNFALSAGVFVHNCILSFYLDVQANEGFLATAVDRENVVRICKLIGYQLQAPTAASVGVTLTLAATQLNDVVIAAGTSLVSENGLTFEFLTEGRVSAGSLTGAATITQGESKTDTFTADGSAFQKYLLTGTPVIDGSIAVTVDGETWTETESLVYGDGTSQVFAVVYDVNEDGEDIAYVEFGDGTSGRIPASGTTINVSYRTGGGIQGNVGLNQIEESVDGTLDGVVPVTTISVAVTNPTNRGSGGEDRETVNHAKYWAPQWVRTNGRAVTEADFDVLATRFSDATYGSLAYAKARLHQEIPELNRVSLAVWSSDSEGNPAAASAGLIAAVQDYFDNNESGAVRLICVDTVVENGVNLYLDVDVRMAALSNYASADVVQAVRTAIAGVFSAADVLPGVPFRLSNLYKAIQDALGVDYALVDSVKAGLSQTLDLGDGNGVQTTFNGTLTTLPILEYSVSIQAGAQEVADDGSGVLTGDGTGSIDYTTGVVSVTWDTAPALGEDVVCTARYLKQYQRGETESTVTVAASRFRGSVGYHPIVPNSFGLSDGAQTAVDDGSGNLTGDVAAGGTNTIDYDTGTYDVTFASPVIVGLNIASAYRQYLNVNTLDIPVEKSELACQGTVTITTI